MGVCVRRELPSVSISVSTLCLESFQGRGSRSSPCGVCDPRGLGERRPCSAVSSHLNQSGPAPLHCGPGSAGRSSWMCGDAALPHPLPPHRCCCVGGAGGPGAWGLGDSLGIRHFIRTWVVSVSTSLQKRRAFQSITCGHRCWGRGGLWTMRDFSPTAGVSLPLEL